MLGGRKNDITWAQFEVCNENPQSAFENMCRWLFNDFFFNGKAILHSEPNNPGVEVIPVYHEDSKEAMMAAGIDSPFPILHHLIDEKVSVRLKNDSILISQSDLFDLDFWDRYGLGNRKLKFVASLLRSGFFIVSPHKDMEWYSLGYNLLEDFVQNPF